MNPKRRLRLMKMMLTLLLATLLFEQPLAAAAASAPASKTQVQTRAELERSVKQWIQDLSGRKPFVSWQKATSQIEALGPGTHGWLVSLFAANGTPAGYMIVYASDEPDTPYRLGEYGVGKQPLFDIATMKRTLYANGWISSMKSNGYTAIKHYLHPFAAAWEIRLPKQTVWLDAKSGEQLPLDASTWAQVVKSFTPDVPASLLLAKPETNKLNETFDPYERLPWLLDEKPLSADPDQLIRRLTTKAHLRFVSEPFGDKMLYALPVIGYQNWSNGRLDLALDMNGTRYVPFSLLAPQGLFYR